MGHSRGASLLLLFLVGCGRDCAGAIPSPLKDGQRVEEAARPERGSGPTLHGNLNAYPDVDSGEGPGGIAITQPAPNNVWRVDGGVAESLPPVTGPQASGASPVTSPIRLRPVFREGAAYGFEVLSVAEGSSVQKAGLLPGDILLEVDGTRLDSPEKTLGLQALGGSRFEVEIERDGRRRRLVSLHPSEGHRQ